jgi:lysophospholipase L1-like esterase
MKIKLPAIFFALLVFASIVSAQTYDRAKLWQAEIDALVEIDRRQTPPKNAVLFVGSSSIRKWDNLRRDFAGVNVMNRGFGGSHIEDVNYYFDQLVTPFQAKKIFFYAGENDITAGKTPETVAADFAKFAALVREKSPRSKLYFISLKPSPSRCELRDKFQRTNALIKAECEKSGVKYIDVWTPMLGANGEPKPEIFVEDNLHLNQRGYDIWREILVKYLK